MHRNPSPPGGGEGRRAMRQGRDLEDYYAQLGERLRMLSLYFCRAVRVECPASLYKEKIAYTGTSIFRPEWRKIYRILKAGDTVVFDSVSRMSRHAEEGFALYEDLYCKGIRLIFLKEHHIDTETYKKALSGSIVMTGTNVDFILKGINEYLMALAKEKIRIHCKAFGGTLDDMECMKLTGLARNTYYKYKRQIREDTEMKD